MPGPRDNALVLRSAGNLTGTETLTTTIYGGVHRTSPMSVCVLFPQTSGADTVKVTAKCTTTGKKVEVTHTTNVIGGTTTFPFLLKLPLPFTDGTAWSVVLTVSGGNFGVVLVWLEYGDIAKVNVE